jgi:capsule biosynthesis phosphatase
VNPEGVICFDVDDTLCVTKNRDYANSEPIEPMVARLREAKANGWRVVLYTARGQGRSNGQWETVAEEVKLEIAAFCQRHNVPYDEIIVGKPWAKWYVDDKALRPDEFLKVEL